MGWKMVPQITGLVRGEPQPGQKHRANGKAILGEMGEERHSASLTLDKSRSHLNEYGGFRSGFECWDGLVDAADAFRVKVNTKNGVRERRLPPDAVIGWAAIYNPPAEMTTGWDAAQYARFFDDCRAVMAEIVPDVFRQDNRRMSALHKDEGYPDELGQYGWNLHDVGVPLGKNGRYCGNLIDAKRCVEICRDFPRMMRERGGWELDDLDLTDFTRMGYQTDKDGKQLLDADGKPIPIDPAYRAERQAKRREQGRKTNKYIADKKARAAELTAQATEKAAGIVQDAQEQARGIVSQATQDATAAAARITAQATTEAARTKAQAVRDGTAEAKEQLRSLSGAILTAQLQNADLERKNAALEREIGDRMEFMSWKAAKRAQEAQETARKEQEAQEARARQEAAKRAQEAQEAARREQEARTARTAQGDASRLLTDDEMVAEFRRRMGYDAPAATAAAPEQPKEQPTSGGLFAGILARAERAAKQPKDTGPWFPGP